METKTAEILMELEQEDIMLKELKRRFTDEQLADIYLTPVIISHIVLHYSALATDYAATNRLPYKTVVRKIRELSREFDIRQRGLLTVTRYDDICGQVDDLITTNARHFAILYWTINGEWKKHYPDDVHDEMRTFAIMAQSFIQVAHHHVRQINEWARLGQQSLSRVHPIIENIGYLLNILIGDATIIATDNINLAIKIINNILNTSTFSMR